MWNRAVNVTKTGGSLSLSASAAVGGVSDTAAPADLDGTWVGDVCLGTDAIHVGGPAQGGALVTATP
jgi:hypothetical protein